MEQEEEKYVVRLYDRYDGYWIDITPPCSYDAAKKYWDKETSFGTNYTKYADGAYYKIFPANKKMLFNSP